MYEGNPVDLQMEKVISADAIFDDTTRACKVDHYDTEEDYIYLEVMENPLTTILLDAKYRCYISTGTELLCCSGVVKERYQSEDRNLLKFKIENGFYEMNERRSQRSFRDERKSCEAEKAPQLFFYKKYVNCVDK